VSCRPASLGLPQAVASRAAPGGPDEGGGAGCGGGGRLRVHFYDVGQALAALVDLPDGRHVLVDAGDDPRRPGCGEACVSAGRHLIDALSADLGSAPIDLLWITHPHSDHVGGAAGILETFRVLSYADNGRGSKRPEVRRARAAAEERGARVSVVDPEHSYVPIEPSSVRLRAIVPAAWPASCARDENECSIGLRLDFCASSVLFMGDAEHDEEARLDPGGPVTLVQVGHHGSETSTTPGFLAKVRPRYAVVSAGRPGEGLNVEYCHPRAIVLGRLTALLGGAGGRTILGFDGDRCAGARADDWVAVPSSDRLWATERDGDVVLGTTGDGVFARE
jgi:competence protein ComEC